MRSATQKVPGDAHRSRQTATRTTISTPTSAPTPYTGGGTPTTVRCPPPAERVSLSVPASININNIVPISNPFIHT